MRKKSQTNRKEDVKKNNDARAEEGKAFVRVYTITSNNNSSNGNLSLSLSLK